jgi:hypothetical protein
MDEKFLSIKMVLNLGFEIHSRHYKLNTTNWGDQKTKFEYALTYQTGKVEYYYDDKESEIDDVNEAIILIMEDLKQGWE